MLSAKSTLAAAALAALCAAPAATSAAAAATSATTPTFSSFRRDYFLDDKIYPEYFTPDPVHGGRVHIIGPAAAAASAAAAAPKPPFSVALSSGASANTDPVKGPASFGDNFDWLHVDVNPETNQVAVSFHTHSDDLVSKLNAIKVTDAQGRTVLDSAVELPSSNATHPLAVTYVTTADDFTNLIVHVHNYDAKRAQNVTQVQIDGVAISDLGAFSLSPGEHRVLKAPLPAGKGALTQVWTVGLVVADGTRLGYGGRHVREHFPIADWPKSGECPFPLSNATNYELLKRTLSVDTHFAAKRQCNNELKVTLADAAKRAGTKDAYFVMPSHAASEHPDHVPASAAAAIIALGCGDESDNAIDNAPPTWAISRSRRETFPWAVQYLGGHSHKFIGTFAGISDISSTDFYVGACAPHVTSTLSKMVLRGAYDYLRNNRNNHMPLTSWGYSQAFQIWRSGIGIPSTVNAGEVTSQIASVVAAGNKGIQLFQTMVSLHDSDRAAWNAASEILSNIAAVRDLLREGDAEGAPFTKDDGDTQSLVSVIAAPGKKLVVIAINLNANGYNGLLCYAGIDANWKFQPHTIGQLEIQLPSQFAGAATVTLEESAGGALKPATEKHALKGNALSISGIDLGTDVAARIFVVSAE
jgi:hypothetical protein